MTLPVALAQNGWYVRGLEGNSQHMAKSISPLASLNPPVRPQPPDPDPLC